jgi:hypothetical protein
MEDVARQSALAHRVLAMLGDHPGLLLEELLDRCPDATWNQAFAMVNHLSRTGDIRLTPQGMVKYHVNLHAAQHSPGIYK